MRRLLLLLTVLFGVALLVFAALPAVDNFNRADANPIGGNWTTMTGFSDIQIVSQTAAAAGTGNTGIAYWNADTFPADQYAQFTATPGSDDSGVIVRFKSATQQFYLLMIGSGGGTIFYYDGSGNFTALSGTLGTYNASSVYKITAVGTTITAYQDGSSIGSVTDGRVDTGVAGLFLYHTGTADNWQAGAVGGGGGGGSAAPTRRAPVFFGSLLSGWHLG